MKIKVLVLVSIMAVIVSFNGCSDNKQSQASIAKSSPITSKSNSIAGCEFLVPYGWTQEQIQGGVLLMAPQVEDGWQANLFLEVREDNENRSLEQALADLSKNLSTRKQQFIELSRKFDKNANGVQYGVLEYSCVSGDINLRELEIVVEYPNNKRFFVLASSASNNWEKYQPLFRSFLDSIK